MFQGKVGRPPDRSQFRLLPLKRLAFGGWIVPTCWCSLLSANGPSANAAASVTTRTIANLASRTGLPCCRLAPRSPLPSSRTSVPVGTAFAAGSRLLGCRLTGLVSSARLRFGTVARLAIRRLTALLLRTAC